MLRQDGTSFPVKVHLYCMDDDDLSSEAECASFLVRTESKDQDIAKYVLDCWMALLIENSVRYDATEDDIDTAILQQLSSLPYSFPYKLSNSQLLNIHKQQHNYYDVDTLYDFIDHIRDSLFSIQNQIKWSINQQFCRVRYGGEYDTDSSNNTLWFRISSVNFNWANVIYVFASEYKAKLKVRKITICRDFESDNNASGTSEYFYKAKDGAVYRDMPINEFLAEEHEHSLVFSCIDLGAGPYHNMKQLLSQGDTLNTIHQNYPDVNLYRAVNWFKRQEIQSQCIHCSEFLEKSSTRIQAKLGRVMRKIRQYFPEITEVDVVGEPRDNNKGKPTGMTYTFTLSSEDPKIDGLEVRLGYTKPFVPEDILFRDFKLDYLMYTRSMLK